MIPSGGMEHPYYSTSPQRPTPRQAEALWWAAAYGLDSAEVADRMTITPNTAHAHLQAARTRLGARNLANAVWVAWHLGWLSTGGRSA